jgi:hypothetical protein
MTRGAVLAAVLATACHSGVSTGTTGPNGPSADGVWFWHLLTSTVDFGTCSDNVDFRKGAQPLTLTDNTYIVYRTSTDGKSAAAQSCPTLDASSCTPAAGGLMWSVVGSELTAVTDKKDPVGTGGCALDQTQTWTLQDQGAKMTVEVDNVLTLVDSPSACATIEANLKANSPNGLGAQGCVVTFQLTGELR